MLPLRHAALRVLGQQGRDTVTRWLSLNIKANSLLVEESVSTKLEKLDLSANFSHSLDFFGNEWRLCGLAEKSK